MSPTGKPVVPNDWTRLRQWALKQIKTQSPRLRRAIRPAAKSAEAKQRYIEKFPPGATHSSTAKAVVSCVGG